MFPSVFNPSLCLLSRFHFSLVLLFQAYVASWNFTTTGPHKWMFLSCSYWRLYSGQGFVSVGLDI